MSSSGLFGIESNWRRNKFKLTGQTFVVFQVSVKLLLLILLLLNFSYIEKPNGYKKILNFWFEVRYAGNLIN